LMSSVDQEGAVLVEGEVVGHIEGLRFKPDANKGEHSRVLLNAAQKAVSDALAGRAQSLVAAPDPDLSLSETGEIIWLSHPLGRLVASDNLLKPRVELLADQQVSGYDREAVQLRLSKFVSRHIAGLLEPLVALADDEVLTGLARGVAFQLIEATGILPRERVADQIKELGQDDRASLRKHGVRFGAFHIFIPALLKPAPTALRLLLWALHDAEKRGLNPAALPQYVPQQGLTSVPFNRETPRGFYQVVGFRHCGERAVRVDMLERLADMVRTRVFWRPQREGEERPNGSVEGGGFTVVPDMMSLVGCSGNEFASILRSLGFSAQRRKIEPAASETAEAPSCEVDTAASEAPAADAAASPAEAPAEATRPEPVPAQSAQAAAAGAETAAEEVAEEPQFIDVWWPKDTGPFRHQKQAHRQHKTAGRPGGGKGKQGGKPRHQGEGGKPRRSAGSQPAKPRKEREADPNSPFAVLSQLKQDLSRK
jgi:ATP-dependent RNA helicase SUPV3L1/SUV3